MRMMLAHLGMDTPAKKVSNAIQSVLAEGKVKTRDMGGIATTKQMGDEIASSVGGI